MKLQLGARSSWPGVIEAYPDRIRTSPGSRVVTLQEGGTPLLPAPTLSLRTGCEVLLKVEGPRSDRHTACGTRRPAHTWAAS